MGETLFSKIIDGEIPSYEVYEDEHSYAFLDIHPITPGHTLVVPKKQVEFIWDMDEEDYENLMASAKIIARHLREALKVPYVGVQVIGVDVPHAHIHLIPFTSVRDYRNIPDPNAEPDHEALAAVAARVTF